MSGWLEESRAAVLVSKWRGNLRDGRRFVSFAADPRSI